MILMFDTKHMLIIWYKNYIHITYLNHRNRIITKTMQTLQKSNNLEITELHNNPNIKLYVELFSTQQFIQDFDLDYVYKNLGYAKVLPEIKEAIKSFTKKTVASEGV